MSRASTDTKTALHASAPATRGSPLARRAGRAVIVLLVGAISLSGAAALADDSPPVVLERKLDLRRAGHCRAHGWVRNLDGEHHVAVVLLKTQRLFSGEHQHKIGLVVPPGGRRPLGCVHWRGAMRPVEYQVLETWIYPPPRVLRRDPKREPGVGHGGEPPR